MTSPNAHIGVIGRLLRKIKNNPVTAGIIAMTIIVVIAVCGMAAARRSNDSVIATARPGKSAGSIGTRQDKAVLWRSYELGNLAATLGWYATDYLTTMQGNGADPFANTPDSVSLARTEAVGLFKDLKMDVDVTQLNFVSPIADQYGYSTGATFIGKGLEAQYGPPAKQAYETGLALENALLLAQMKRFEWPSPSSDLGPDDATSAIESLDESVKVYGADGVDTHQLIGKDQGSFNLSAHQLIEKLQANVEQRLNPGVGSHPQAGH